MTRRDAGEEVEVVIEDGRVHRLTAQKHHPGAWQPEQHKHAEHPLFVVLDPCDLGQDIAVQAQARVDDHGTRSPRVRENPLIERRKPPLQLGKAAQFLC